MAMRTTPDRMTIATGAGAAPKRPAQQSRAEVTAKWVVNSFMEHARLEDVLTARERQVVERMALPVDDEHRTEAGLRYWLSFVQLKYGAATRPAWEVVCQALNIAMILAEDDIGGEYLGELIEAQNFAFLAYQRGERMGSYRLDGPGLHVVARALEIHDAQLAVCLWGDITIAEKKMTDSLAEGNVFEAVPLAA